MYLVDTDVLIWALRGKKDIIEKLLSIKETWDMGISVISIAEIYKHIFPSELTQTENFLNQHIHIDVNPSMARMAGLYWQEYNKNIKNISLTDCIIAATAKHSESILLTYNTKHFPMQDITVINPNDI